MKTVFFDIESYEEIYLKDKGFILDTEALNDSNPIKSEYKDAEIISVFTTSRVNKKVLEQFKNLKLIALRSVGYNHIDLEYCKEHDIRVVNSPNYGNITVAEFALALLLNVTRRITISYMDFKDAKISPANLIGVELFGKTVGIVGLGAIGSEFARIAYGLGMKIFAFDKFEKEEVKTKYNVTYVDFKTLLKESDFISIHAPYTKDNHHMFDEKAFEKMKGSAIIINTGRGELIDSQALYNALINKKIAGAGLDVLESEEIMADFDYIGINRLNKETLRKTLINSQLFKLDNVIITPHTAYNSKEGIERIINTTLGNIEAFTKGEIKNEVKL